MKKFATLLSPIEAKMVDGLGYALRYKWYHPLSYVAITITIVESLYFNGFKNTFKDFESPFKWQVI